MSKTVKGTYSSGRQYLVEKNSYNCGSDEVVWKRVKGTLMCRCQMTYAVTVSVGRIVGSSAALLYTF